MIQFNANRFLSVAKWDLTVNRSFYTKSALVILVVMALPALGDLAFMPFYRAVAAVAYGTINNYILILPLLFGYMLHNLRSRQGRINELTLPASNFEKFLWHVCLILFGSLFVAVVSFFAIDLLYNLTIALYHGPDYAQEFVASLSRFGETGFGVRFSLTVTLLYLLLISTFVLGNAMKYRHNITMTIAWDMAAVFLTIIASFATLSHRIKLLSQTMYTGDLHLDDVVNFHWVNVSLCVVMACLVALCWWVAYVLYAKATITSQRNP